jgi:LEA14-like dessication related protein
LGDILQTHLAAGTEKSVVIPSSSRMTCNANARTQRDHQKVVLQRKLQSREECKWVIKIQFKIDNPIHFEEAINFSWIKSHFFSPTR